MKKRSLFLVDDEKDILDLYHAALSSKYDVMTFSGPEQVVQAITEGKSPDVIVSDMRMPKMSGIELIQWVRARNMKQPFVVISGYSEKFEAMEAMKFDPVELLEKPFSIDQLKLMVGRAVRVAIYQELVACINTVGSQVRTGLSGNPALETGMDQILGLAHEVNL